VDIEGIEPLDRLLDCVGARIQAHKFIDEGPAAKEEWNSKEERGNPTQSSELPGGGDRETIKEEVDNKSPKDKPKDARDDQVQTIEGDGVGDGRDQEEDCQQDDKGGIIPRPLVLRLYNKSLNTNIENI